MIRANEIRIGNLFRYGNPIHKNLPMFSVDQIWANLYWLSDGSHISHENDNLCGVPLTPELLVKCGFAIAENLIHTVFYSDVRGEMNLQVKVWSVCFCLGLQYGGGFIALKNISYLHELQNAYWILANKELILTPLN